MPLLDVVRENDDPAHDRDFGEDFQVEMITCVPLHGNHILTNYSNISAAQITTAHLMTEFSQQNWVYPNP